MRIESVAAVLAVAGGIAVLVGTVLPWVRASATFAGGEILGRAVPPELLTAMGDADVVAAGRDLAPDGLSDWTGRIAAVAGLAVLGLGFVALVASGRRARPWLLAASAGGAMAVIMAVVAATGTERIARDELIAPVRDAVDRMVGGFGALGLGGFLEAMVEEVGGLFEIEARPGPGLFLSGGGGLLAAAVAGALVSPTGTTERFRRAAAALSPEARAELLAILTSPPEVRAETSRRLASEPGREGMAELVQALERDERTRLAVVSALRARAGGSEGTATG